MKCKKPPLGIELASFYAKNRQIEILNAMNRYVQSDCKIPEKWVKEYNLLQDIIECSLM